MTLTSVKQECGKVIDFFNNLIISAVLSLLHLSDKLGPVGLGIGKLLQQLVDISKASERTIYVAYSGGMDSSVLLHACVNLHQRKVLKLPICAWHINHQLQAEADDWEKHCQDEAAKYSVDFKSSKVGDNPDKQESMEMFARRSRYEIWQKELNPGDILLQAHHQRDQAETLLMRIVRASPNLKGIPQVRYINSKEELQLSSDTTYEELSDKVLVVRPLINLSKQSITDYAKKYKVKYISDPSNSDTKHERSYIRHNILPLLEEKWPGAEKSIAASAQQLSSYNNIVAEKQSQLLHDFYVIPPATNAEDTKSLDHIISYSHRPGLQIGHSTDEQQDQSGTRPLYDLTENEFALSIKAWLNTLSIASPSTMAIKELHRQLKDNSNDPITDKGIEWQYGAIRAYKNALHAVPPTNQEDAKERLNIDIAELISSSKDITLGMGKLSLCRVETNELDDYYAECGAKAKQQKSIIYGVILDWDNLAGHPLSVGSSPILSIVCRKGGEKMIIHPDGAKKEVKELFQEHSVPTWLRSYFPLIYVNKEIIAIPGVVCHPDFKFNRGKAGLAITWEVG